MNPPDGSIYNTALALIARTFYSIRSIGYLLPAAIRGSVVGVILWFYFIFAHIYPRYIRGTFFTNTSAIQYIIVIIRAANKFIIVYTTCMEGAWI